MDDIVKIHPCDGGDVELGARTSKYILVFAIDSLSLNSLSLSLILCIASYFPYHLYAWVIVCLTCVKPRELYIAPQLLFRGI